MIKAADLIDLFWYAINNEFGYIFGRYGQVWTEANQRAATRVQTVRCSAAHLPDGMGAGQNPRAVCGGGKARRDPRLEAAD